MKKMIHNLRQQPEEVRRHILHVSTIVLGFILLGLWVWTLGSSLGNEETEAKIQNDLEPLSAMKDNIVNGYQSIDDEEDPYNFD